MTRSLIRWLGLGFLLFLGFRAGRGQSEPFDRQAFTLPTATAGTLKCVAIIPRQVPPYPVVVYAHAVGGTLANDEPELRQLAEVGLGAVSLDYTQTNPADFPGQLQAVLAWVNRQPWVKTNSMVWMGLSLGANHLMEQAFAENGPKPQILVLMSSHGSPETSPQTMPRPFPGPVLLLHGEQDTIFPWTDDERLFTELTQAGTPATIKVFPGLGHGFEPERGVIVRGVGEYCAAQLGGTNCWRNLYSPANLTTSPARWLWWLAAAVWLAAWRGISRGTTRPGAAAQSTGARVYDPQREPARTEPESTFAVALPAERCGSQTRAPGAAGAAPGMGLCLFAAVLTGWVLAVIFVYVITPHLPVGKLTLAIAGNWIVPPEERADFAYLASQPAWQGQPLKACFDQIQWAGYVRNRFSLRTDDALYRQYCLSPFITGATSEAADWRRTLSTEFIPVIGGETNAAAAATLIVRQLRADLAVADLPQPPRAVSEIWRRRLTDVTGFEIIYVAALRSVGIPARLDGNHLAELWNGANWQTAPSPALMAW